MHRRCAGGGGFPGLPLRSLAEQRRIAGSRLQVGCGRASSGCFAGIPPGRRRRAGSALAGLAGSDMPRAIVAAGARRPASGARIGKMPARRCAGRDGQIPDGHVVASHGRRRLRRREGARAPVAWASPGRRRRRCRPSSPVPACHPPAQRRPPATAARSRGLGRLGSASQAQRSGSKTSTLARGSNFAPFPPTATAPPRKGAADA
mmetsp:Transcript_933/g.2987  ORF Transcript_933/g.2987 Transcript_933/m.2987 type:complete len:205 (+) Transcript_933:59-673(+)